MIEIQVTDENKEEVAYLLGAVGADGVPMLVGLALADRIRLEGQFGIGYPRKGGITIITADGQEIQMAKIVGTGHEWQWGEDSQKYRRTMSFLSMLNRLYNDVFEGKYADSPGKQELSKHSFGAFIPMRKVKGEDVVEYMYSLVNAEGDLEGLTVRIPYKVME